MTVITSWLVIAVVFALLWAIAGVIGHLLDQHEDRRQRRLRARWDADLLQSMTTVNEQSSRAMFEALMKTGSTTSFSDPVVPSYPRRVS